MDLWMLLLLLPVAWVGHSFYRGYRSPARLEEMAEALAQGGSLVDVRTPKEYAAGHHRRARNIPLSDLRTRMDELDPEAAVVVYCRSGSRSLQALPVLRNAGFSRVYDLGPLRNTEKLPEIQRAKRAPLTRNQRKRERKRQQRRKGSARG